MVFGVCSSYIFGYCYFSGSLYFIEYYVFLKYFNLFPSTHILSIRHVVLWTDYSHSLTWACLAYRAVFRMPVYLIHHSQQLTATMKQLIDDFFRERIIHVCKLRHRDTMCCSSAAQLHDGAWDFISCLYIAPTLRMGVRQILRNIMHYFPAGHENLDEDFIFTCPGCNIPFAEQ